MKKLVVLITAALLALTLVSCSADSADTAPLTETITAKETTTETTAEITAVAPEETTEEATTEEETEPPLDPVFVKLPERFTAYANGVELTDEYVTVSGLIEDERETVPEGAYLFTYKICEVSGMYEEPQITAKDENGEDVSLLYDAETRLYSCGYEYSEELKEQYSDYVIKAMKAYAVYMQNDSSFGDVRGYFDPSTVLYNDMRLNPGSFVWEHNGYRIENMEVSGFFDYGGVISCRVRFDHVLKKDGKEDYTDYNDHIVYLRRVESDYKIFCLTESRGWSSLYIPDESKLLPETQDVSDGIEFYTDSAGTFRAYVMIVHDPSKVFVGVSSNDFPNAVRGQRIYDAAEKYGAIAAINGGEFSDPGGEGLGGQPIGLTYTQGRYVWPAGAKRTFIGIDQNDKLIVTEGMTREEAQALGIRDGVSFQTGNVLIETGEDGKTQCHYRPEKTEKAQRTAIGQRADGKFVFIVTDGRSSSSVGASYDDVTDMMLKYGAINAGMLDGGSSAMMYYKNYIEKYDVNVGALDEYQRLGLVNKYKIFTRPRYLPTFFMVMP